MTPIFGKKCQPRGVVPIASAGPASLAGITGGWQEKRPAKMSRAAIWKHQNNKKI
jgi:hypothetical protein